MQQDKPLRTAGRVTASTAIRALDRECPLLSTRNYNVAVQYGRDGPCDMTFKATRATQTPAISPTATAPNWRHDGNGHQLGRHRIENVTSSIRLNGVVLGPRWTRGDDVTDGAQNKGDSGNGYSFWSRDATTAPHPLQGDTRMPCCCQLYRAATTHRVDFTNRYTTFTWVGPWQYGDVHNSIAQPTSKPNGAVSF